MVPQLKQWCKTEKENKKSYNELKARTRNFANLNQRKAEKKFLKYKISC